MKFYSLIVYRFVCLLLMINLVAVNIRSDYYMSIFKYTNISKDFELEEESLPKSKTTETDNTDNAIDEFLNSLSSIHKIASFAGYAESTEKLIFHFSINAIPNVHYEIQSPPPRI